MQSTVYVIATMDTKGQETEYVSRQIQEAGLQVQTVDVATLAPATVQPDISRNEVYGGQLPSWDTRAEALSAMGRALKNWLLQRHAEEQIAGVIGLGGSGGTALISEGLRALPIGIPKLMVSTVASGNTQPYVDCSDITMMYSVVDIAGINSVSERILSNAAAAISGMAAQPLKKSLARPTLGMTMFGVTTPCVTKLREDLEAQDFDCLVFHATGTGGRAMEKLVSSGLIQGVIDVTTTEVADEIAGGIMPAGPSRFEPILAAGIPYVLSLGAVDMVNFGSMDTVPEHYRKRQLYAHNDHITLMRTTLEENLCIARWIAGKLKQTDTPITLVLPEGGVSALDAPNAQFFAPDITRALFEELETLLADRPHCQIVRSSHHINDPEFAETLLREFLRLTGL